MRRKRRRRFGDCGSKVRFGCRAEATAEQPGQIAYECWRCGCWHLTSLPTDLKVTSGDES